MEHFRSFLKEKENRMVIAIGVLLVLFVCVRIAAIDERTIHIDEGMGLRASQLALEGQWRYYPANGHGPTLFYLGAALRPFFGASIVAARMLTAVSGILTILVLLWTYRSTLKTPGKLALLGFLGLSSGLVFYSAYFIHEPIFILLTACVITSAEYWLRTKKTAGLVGIATSFVLMYATKETAILTWAAWCASLVAVFFLFPQTRSVMRKISYRSLKTAILIAAFFYVLLMSSLFANFRGVLDSIGAPSQWLDRAQSMHLRPFGYFLELLFVHEFALLFFALLLVPLITVRRKWSPHLVFFAVWTACIFFIYSAIRYKTPWNMPNIILPMGLFAAFAFDELWSGLQKHARLVIGGIMAVLICGGFVRMVQDNFIRPDLETSHSYAYLQSDESLGNMLRTLDDLAILHASQGQFLLQVMGNVDELLYMITGEFRRSFGQFAKGYPVYVNYQHSAEEMQRMLDESEIEYVRAIYTYIQHVNQVDLFVEKSLWEKYESSDTFIEPKSREGNVYDYR